ncbi:MAG: hypothetical protein K2L77_06025, partial [Muribaculaceae bacterium]|nr:hypothetical protein [Muribaculaceae bacterium]
MNRLPFITLLILLLSAACGHDSRLDTAAALMYPAPDSAMALLDSIDPASLHGEHEHARYALLYSQAQNKNHIFPTSDSLINIAVSYYDHSGHDSLRMLAHFYRSVIYNSTSAHHSALRDALLAKDLAESLHQPYWVARASQEIADAYYQSYDMDNSIRYSDIAARNFTRTGYHLNSHYVTVDKAAALNYRGHYNESLRILDSLANVIDTTDYNICAYLWNVRIKPLNALGRHNEAFTYAYKSISATPLIIEPTFQYCDIANLHTTIGQLDSAAYYLDKGRAQDSMTYFYSNSYYLENKGDYQGALKSFRSYFKIRNKLLNDLINDNISVEEKEYISNKAGIDAKVQRRKTMIITCCSVTLMLILALLILYMRAQYRIRQIESDRKLSDALDAMTELSGDNISLLARLSSASDTIACQNTARQQLA